MKKLKLEHIVPYLPYGLNFLAVCLSSGESEILGVSEINLENEYTVIGSSEFDLSSLGGDEVKPILRPLSDLTKEIEHKGERFVPIIELSKLVDNGHNHINSQIHKSSNYITVLTGKCDDVENVRFQFTIEGISAIKRSGEAISFVTYDKIKRKILSWHLDVFGLIYKGLAIDINTLEK